MLVIRLSRVGKKNKPEYRLIINEKHKDPWGDALEYLGYYNPRTEPPTVAFKIERIKYWLSQGAQVSNTVRNLLIDEGILKDKKVKPKGVRRKKKDEKQEKDKQMEEGGSVTMDKEAEGQDNQPSAEDKKSSTSETGK